MILKYKSNKLIISSYLGKSKDEEDILEMVREGIQIYEKLRKSLSPDLLAGNSIWFQEIQKTHLYFLKQGKAAEYLKTNATQFYSVKAI